MIILLSKSNKGYYTQLLAYWPILLLSTLNKAIKSPIANWIAYLADKYSFLLRNLFGRLKDKNIIDVLVVF